MSFLASSVHVKTRKAYERQWKKWVDYLGASENPFLDDVVESDKISVLVMFLKTLYDRNLRGKGVTSILTGVRQWFVFNHRDTQFFNSRIVEQAEKATRYSVLETRIAAQLAEQNAMIPISLEFLLRMREVYWSRTPVSKEEFDHAGVYIAIMLCYDSGSRIGSFTLRDGPDGSDHCVRGDQVIFTTSTGHRYSAGNAFREAVRKGSVSMHQIESVDVHIYTQKDCIKSGVVVVREPCRLLRRSIQEAQFLEDLCCWCIFSGVLESDEIVTRYFRNLRKVITRKEVNQALKDMATKLDLPPSRISSCSLRKGFATSAISSGLTREQACARGGWKPSSQAIDDYYAVNINTSGGVFLGTSAYTLRDMKRM